MPARHHMGVVPLKSVPFKVAVLGVAVDTESAKEAVIHAIERGMELIGTSEVKPQTLVLQFGKQGSTVSVRTLPRGQEIHTCAPEEFRCSACGGAMGPETVGMFSGTRWVHTCGESLKDRRERLGVSFESAKPCTFTQHGGCHGSCEGRSDCFAKQGDSNGS